MNDELELSILKARLKVAVIQLILAALALVFLVIFLSKAQINIINKADELKECQEELATIQSYFDSGGNK